MRVLIGAAVVLASGLSAPARSQEIGVYGAAGVGGFRDVRRPFGGGLEATWLFHDWIGIRADAGWYWTLEHRTTPICQGGAGEAIVCTSTQLASHSHFPQLDGMLLFRAHIPGKGVRLEGGIGPTWINATNEIRTEKDSVFSPSLSSSAAGLMMMVGVLAHPSWKLPVDLEGAYAYHMTGRFGACTTGSSTDPLCDRSLNFHELRLSLFYRFAAIPR